MFFLFNYSLRCQSVVQKNMHVYRIMIDREEEKLKKDFQMYAKLSDELWQEANEVIVRGQHQGKRVHIH